MVSNVSHTLFFLHHTLKFVLKMFQKTGRAAATVQETVKGSSEVSAV